MTIKKAFLLTLSLLLIGNSLFAATINFTGFETGDSAESFTSGGTFSIQTGVVRSGQYALRANPTTVNTGSFRIGTHSAQGGLVLASVVNSYIRFYFQYLTKPSANDEEFFQVFSGKLYLRLNSAGNIAIYDSTPTIITTGSTVLSSGTWYRIEVMCGTGNPASWELKINGVTEASGSNNVTASNTTSILLGKGTNRNGKSVDFYYDDFLWSDSAYPGAGASVMLVPNANGTNQGYTVGAGSGSHFQIVNAVPNVGDSAYLLSPLVLNTDETENMTDTADAGVSGTINSFKSIIIIKNDGASNGSILTTILSGGTFAITSLATGGAAYVLKGLIRDTDPHTSAAWTTSALDSVQCGVREESTVNKTRVTSIFGTVDYTPSSGPPQRTLTGVGQ